MNIPITLHYLRPQEQWSVDGNQYSGIKWLSDTPMPTEDEIIAAWPAAEKAYLADIKARIDAKLDAIAHAKSLGFTDAMIAVMYPNLVEA